MRDRTLDRLTISQPCTADWDSMAGNDQVRFCEHCNLHVNDLSRMTRSEAMRLVAESRGRLCVRYVRLPNGRTVTSDLPAKLYGIGRRASRIAAGAFTAAISLSSVQAQGGASFSKSNERSERTVELIHIERQRQPLIDEFTGSVAGTIKTSEGVPLSDATVILVDRESGQELTTLSSSRGRYEFQLLPAGDYLIWARKRGFTTYAEQIQVNANQRLRKDVELNERQLTSMLLGGVGLRIFQAEDPLIKAISENDLAMVRTLALADPNLNAVNRARDMSVLANAIEGGNREIVGILLAAGAGVNVRNNGGRTGLMFLTDRAGVELVRDLIAAGAKVNARDNFGNDAFMQAIDSSSAAVLKELVTAGARVDATNQDGETALFFAARGDDPEVVTLVLSLGAQLEVRNEEDETPLLSMASNGSFEIFKVLIERGANFQISDLDGQTVLMKAALNEDPRLVKLLIEMGADVNARSLTDTTALMNAAALEHTAVIELLAHAGADLNAKDVLGETALMKAAEQGQLESVEALLKAGADLTVKDKEGKTALALARENEYEEIVELLKLRGARQ